MSKRMLAALAALLASLAAFIVVLSGGDEPPAPAAPVTVTVNEPEDGGTHVGIVKVPAVAVEQAEKALTGDAQGRPLPADDADHTNLADETPEGAPAAALEQNAEALQENRETTEALPTAGASAGFAGCRTQFVGNQSSRAGVKPTVQVLHYTVSPNRPGWSDVNAVVALFDRPSFKASSNFVVDAEGNCAYIVPIESKAWTQAGGNPWAVSYEIIATGQESAYLAPAGYRKLRSVMLEVSRRTGIPMRRGAVSGCAPTRSGIVEHRDGGTCWGGHSDIGPFQLASVLTHVVPAPCGRACDLRKRNTATHRQLTARHCAPPERTRSETCRFLHRRHAALHAAAKREGVKL